jgi:hypothetical protein
VNAGTLALKNAGATTASLGNTAITVASGATFSATVAAGAADKTVGAGSGGAGTVGATLTLDPGSTFTLAGTAIGTFDLRQDASFSGAAFTIGGASGIKPSLIFDIGNGSTGTDLIDVTKDVDVLTTGGDISIDALAGDTGLTPGNYDLIAAAGGFSGSDGNGLSLSGTTLNVGGTTYDLSLDHSTEDDEILTVSAAPPVSGAIGQPAAFREDFKPATTLNAPLVGTTAVPEPGADASMLSAFGIAAAWLMRRRRKERASVVAPGL